MYLYDVVLVLGPQGDSEGDGPDGEDHTWPGRQEMGQPEDQIQGDNSLTCTGPLYRTDHRMYVWTSATVTSWCQCEHHVFHGTASRRVLAWAQYFQLTRLMQIFASLVLLTVLTLFWMSLHTKRTNEAILATKDTSSSCRRHQRQVHQANLQKHTTQTQHKIYSNGKTYKFKLISVPVLKLILLFYFAAPHAESSQKCWQ